jgi:hypothetical protein
LLLKNSIKLPKIVLQGEINLSNQSTLGPTTHAKLV